jgi:hypothetical protein
MNLVLHIFCKDARRLWPAVAVSLALLVLLAINDRWRGDSIVGTTEGWLNLLLPLAWACLLAFAVLEEPLIGDRHFWLTRPHRWQTLLAAKLLFALAFVHLPSLLAAVYIVTARGFSLVECLPQLLAQQAILAAGVTLPAMAMAALVGSFTQFMTLLFAVSAAAIFVSSGGPFRMMADPRRPVDYLRPEFVVAILAVGAIIVVFLQYRRRKVAIARTVAVLAAVMAGGLFGYVPASVDYRVRAALHPAPALSLRLDEVKPVLPPAAMPYNRFTVAVPVTLSGVSEDALYHLGPVDFAVTTQDGSRITNSEVQFARVVRFPSDLPSAPLSLVTYFDPRLSDQLKNQRVRISGRMPVTFFRMGETAWVPVPGRVVAPGVGHCSTTIIDDHWSANNMVKILCESPSQLPRETRLTISIPGTLPDWYQRLGESETFSFNEGHPRWAWLSPLDRGKTFVHTSDPRTRQFSYQLEIPLEHIDRARIGITPEMTTGYTVVDFDFRDVSLSDYYVTSPSRR